MSSFEGVSYDGKETYKVRRFVVKELKHIGITNNGNKEVYSLRNNAMFTLYKNKFNKNPIHDYFNSIKKDEDSDGKIYVIGNIKEGVCKIGYSKTPKKRLNEIQTGCPYDLFILCTFDGDTNMEKLLHKKYSKYRIRNNGEWFYYKGRLKEAVDKIYLKS